MATLKTANVQHCLKEIEDYLSSVPDPHDKAGMEKRERAKKSLERLGVLFGIFPEQLEILGCDKEVPTFLDSIIVGCS